MLGESTASTSIGHAHHYSTWRDRAGYLLVCKQPGFVLL